MEKIKKNTKELTEKLYTGILFIQEQLNSLECYTKEDPMRKERASAVAAKLRVFLSDTNGNQALLSQLGFKEDMLFPWEYYGGQDIASNLVFSSKLVGISVENNSYCCYPKMPKFNLQLFCTFSVWWNEIIIDSKGTDSVLVSRRDVILVLADKEGGAHEDPCYQREYYKINYENGFKYLDSNGNEQVLKNNYYVESLFVIAYEFLAAMEIFIKYIKGKTLKIEETQFNAIQISYKDLKGFYRRRYYTNPKKNLIWSVRGAFDYYRNAQYDIVYLESRLLIDAEKNTTIGFLTINDLKTSPLIYLRVNNENNMLDAVLIKKESGYVRIVDDADIYDCNKVNTLEYYMKTIGNGNPDIFYEFLEKQGIKTV
ncbi:MAG: hypothetical protein J5625_00455 [Lachnospiraceae bacterium]|nr:hypothetical protein [Lachnospiraceae bacterium]